MYKTLYHKHKEEADRFDQSEIAVLHEVSQRAVSQGIADKPSDIIVNDLKPSDLGIIGTVPSGYAVGKLHPDGFDVQYGYTTEEWYINYNSIYWKSHGITPKLYEYNPAIKIKLNHDKVIGIFAIRIQGNYNPVSNIHIKANGRLKQICHVDYLRDDEFYIFRNPIVFNSKDLIEIEFYIKSFEPVKLAFVGYTATNIKR